MKLLKSSGKLKKPRIYIRRVVGHSMSPTLQPGKLVIFVTSKPKVDSIVMLRHDGREKIKRLALERAGRIYVVGDNPPMSTDSRDFGWLPTDTIIAKLLWPRSK